MMLLIHEGRKSGKRRYAVLEVVKYNKEINLHYAASGFGKKSDWFQNISTNPEVSIQSGGKTFSAKAQVINDEEAAKIFEDYTKKYPNAIKNLARFIGYDIGESEQDTLDFLRMIPVVAFYQME